MASLAYHSATTTTTLKHHQPTSLLLKNPCYFLPFIPSSTTESQKIPFRISSELAPKARLVARRKETVPVQQLQRPLVEYMSLPASQYSVLDAERIERVDENTFRCYVYRLKFFSFEVCPVLLVRVEELRDGCCIKLLSCKLEGSPIVVAQNDKFQEEMVPDKEEDLDKTIPAHFASFSGKDRAKMIKDWMKDVPEGYTKSMKGYSEGQVGPAMAEAANQLIRLYGVDAAMRRNRAENREYVKLARCCADYTEHELAMKDRKHLDTLSTMQDGMTKAKDEAINAMARTNELLVEKKNFEEVKKKEIESLKAAHKEEIEQLKMDEATKAAAEMEKKAAEVRDEVWLEMRANVEEAYVADSTFDIFKSILD